MTLALGGAGEIYSVDSSALIHAWSRAYPPKHFPPFWARIDDLITAERFFASIEVLNELKRKDDDLFKWCKKRSQIFLPIDDTIQNHVAEIMGKYPRLVDTVTGRSGGDPFVIGLARMQTPTWIVLSQEHDGKVRIPDVCKSEKIQCINLLDLIVKEDWVFR
jgi:hypothetical protein